MPAFKDRTGQKFGRLTVIERVYPPGRRRAWWRCKCDCGNEKIVSSDSMIRGGVRSCGCLQKENHPKKHGHTTHTTASRLYHTWSGMVQRCTNPNEKYYCNYGGRGIEICEEWRKDFATFKDWAIASGYSDDLFIDRIDNGKGYFPNNCRWVTRYQQQNNLRCNLRYMFSDGKIITNSDMARLMMITKKAVDKTIKDHVVEARDIDPKSNKPHLFILDCTPNEIAVSGAFLAELEKG